MYLGDSLDLQGSRMDPDRDAIVGYRWFIVTSPVGSSPPFGPSDVYDSTFTPDLEGNYTFVQVSYGIDVSLLDFVTIKVTKNQSPTAVAASGIT